jgi:hypothetical protein
MRSILVSLQLQLPKESSQFLAGESALTCSAADCKAPLTYDRRQVAQLFGITFYFPKLLCQCVTIIVAAETMVVVKIESHVIVDATLKFTSLSD